MDAFQILQVRPPGYVHSEALTELAECVYFGLRRLGVHAFYRERANRPARLIVLGAHLLEERSLHALPADAILYNSEQIDANSKWMKGPYPGALRRHTVWDYSTENVRRLASLGAQAVRYVPVGYVPELARIAPTREDIDVLFYGSVNPRRRNILNALVARGLKVVARFGCYGRKRDELIARAKVVLCVHFYEAKIFEIVRAAYVLTNGKALVAETASDMSEYLDLDEAMRSVPYDELVEACVSLVRDTDGRIALARRARQLFSLRREELILADALGLSSAACPGAQQTAPQVASTP